MKMKTHLLTGVALLGALVLAMVGASATIAMPVQGMSDLHMGASAQKIDPLVLASTEAGRSVSFLILMEGQADLNAAYAMRDQDIRGRFVYESLRTYAEKVHRPLREFLSREGIVYSPYWAANAIEARGDRSIVEALAERSDVRMIEPNLSSMRVELPTP